MTTKITSKKEISKKKVNSILKKYHEKGEKSIEDMGTVLKKCHEREEESAEKTGFVKAYKPDGWLPKNPDIATQYLNTLKTNTFTCPICKKPLTLRYEYLIVQNTPIKEAFVPTFVCSNREKQHARHYKMKNGKLTPFE